MEKTNIKMQVDACRHIASSLLNVMRLIKESGMDNSKGIFLNTFNFSRSSNDGMPSILVSHLPDDGSFKHIETNRVKLSNTDYDGNEVEYTKNFNYFKLDGIDGILFQTITEEGESIYD